MVRITRKAAHFLPMINGVEFTQIPDEQNLSVSAEIEQDVANNFLLVDGFALVQYEREPEVPTTPAPEDEGTADQPAPAEREASPAPAVEAPKAAAKVSKTAKAAPKDDEVF